MSSETPSQGRPWQEHGPTVEIVVRWLSLGGDGPDRRGSLSKAEQAYVARFLRDDDRARSRTALQLCRLMLANRTGEAPDKIRLERRCPTCGSSMHGRPSHQASKPYSISISHSGGYVAVALARRAEIGIDLEHRGHGRALGDDLMRWFLAEPELRQLPTPVLPDVLLDWWCRKESALKATGEGLTRDPRDIVTSPPGQPPRVLDGPANLLAVQLFPLVIPQCVAYLAVVPNQGSAEINIQLGPAAIESGW